MNPVFWTHRLINLPTAGVWHCLGGAAAPLPLTSELFGAGAPSSLGSPERLGEFFDLEFLERKELLISWDEVRFPVIFSPIMSLFRLSFRQTR